MFFINKQIRVNYLYSFDPFLFIYDDEQALYIQYVYVNLNIKTAAASIHF